MTKRPGTFISRILCATALGLAVVAAQAASGFNVTPAQQSQIKQGMSSGEVRQLLGQPAIERQYGNQPGPTWIYRLLDFGSATVHVDFSAEGRVASISRRMDYSGDTVSRR